MKPLPISQPLRALIDAIVRIGGRPMAVGGAVRDHVRGAPPKDIDVEVYGVSLEALTTALSSFSVHAVGKSFGVLKVTIGEGVDAETFDVALPRRESKQGRGHRGFVVDTDGDMPLAEAAARRDFTINAMAIDLRDGTLHDPHGGMFDLSARRLRHVSDAFDEDPLRVLRGAQFAARFAMTMAPETVQRCRHLRDELSSLPAERVGEEMRKLLRSPWPSLGLQQLRATSALEALFPELAAMIGCQQEHEWHPEGDVWTHSLMVTDEAALLSHNMSGDHRERIVLAALCHDLGKPATTMLIDGRITSRDHESQGEAPTRSLLARLAIAHDVIEDVVNLVREHLKPFQLWSKRHELGDAAIRRLALRVSIPLLAVVSRADAWGRTTPDAIRREDDATPWLLQQAERLRVYDEAPKPLLLGRHLQQRGMAPGPGFKPVLHAAFEAQLEGVFGDVVGAEAWLDGHLAKQAAS